MRTIDVDILTVPGLTGADPDHWLSRWETRLKTARRVERDDWARAERTTWTGRLIERVGGSVRPVVLIAHSCGVATVVHAAPKLPAGKVVGAFLVAPASEAVTAGLPGVHENFTPFSHDPLPFPSLLIASRTDENCSYEDAGDLALAWGSTLVDAGDVGHLNTASGHGPWPEGAMRFGWFLKQLGDEA